MAEVSSSALATSAHDGCGVTVSHVLLNSAVYGL